MKQLDPTAYPELAEHLRVNLPAARYLAFDDGDRTKCWAYGTKPRPHIHRADIYVDGFPRVYVTARTAPNIDTRELYELVRGDDTELARDADTNPYKAILA